MSKEQPFSEIGAIDLFSLLQKQETQKWAELQVNDNDQQQKDQSKPPAKDQKKEQQKSDNMRQPSAEQKEKALIQASINERPNDDPIVIKAQSDNTAMQLLMKAKLPDPQKFSSQSVAASAAAAATTSVNKQIKQVSSSLDKDSENLEKAMRVNISNKSNNNNPNKSLKNLAVAAPTSTSILNFEEVKFNKNAKSKRNIPQHSQQHQQHNRSQGETFANRKVISKVDRKGAQDSSSQANSNSNQFKANKNTNKKKDIPINRDEIKNSSTSSNLQKEKLFQFPVNNAAAAPPPPLANFNEFKQQYMQQQQQQQQQQLQLQQQQQLDQQINYKAKGSQQSKEDSGVENKDEGSRADAEEVKQTSERLQKVRKYGFLKVLQSNHKQQSVNKGKMNQAKSRMGQQFKFQQEQDSSIKQIPASYLSSNSFSIQTQGAPKNGSQVQQLLKSILSAQEKQTTRLNQIEREISKNPMIQKLQKKIQQKIQVPVEQSVRKSLQKLPQALSHKIYNQLVKNVSQMVKKSFNGCIENLLLPTFQDLFKVTSQKLTQPINRLLIAMKQRIKDEEIRSHSLEKYFMQTIDTLERAVEDVEQHLEGQKEYLEGVKGKLRESSQEKVDVQADDQKSFSSVQGSAIQQKKQELKRQSTTKQHKSLNKKNQNNDQLLESSNSNRDIISETKSVQGINQGYSPFTPRLNDSIDDHQFHDKGKNSFQYSDTASHHSKSVCERANFSNLMDSGFSQDKAVFSVPAQRIQNQLKSKNYQQALQIALREKKQDLIIYVLDNTPDKLVYLSPQILGESFRFMSQNWRPNASVELAKKLPYLKQGQVNVA